MTRSFRYSVRICQLDSTLGRRPPPYVLENRITSAAPCCANMPSIPNGLTSVNGLSWAPISGAMEPTGGPRSSADAPPWRTRRRRSSTRNSGDGRCGFVLVRHRVLLRARSGGAASYLSNSIVASYFRLRSDLVTSHAGLLFLGHGGAAASNVFGRVNGPLRSPLSARKRIFCRLRLRRAGSSTARPCVGAHRRRTCPDEFEPATKVREIVEVLLLARPRNDPGITGHIGDRVVLASKEHVIR